MTAPLTPLDCDLRGLPFMPLDVVRLADSDLVALSTGDEFKAAVMLWAKAWLQIPAASLPDDDRILAHLSGAGSKWRKVKEIALRGFILCDDGRWYHPVIAEKAKEAWAHRLKQRQKAALRWDKEKPERGIAAGDATASAGAMQGTGTGTVIPLPTGNGADPEKIMFDGGVSLLANAGKSETQARTLLGKWKKNHGAEAVIAALGKAQREGAIEPVAFIEGCLRAKARNESYDPERITV